MELYTEKSKIWYFPPDFSKDNPRYAISTSIIKPNSNVSGNESNNVATAATSDSKKSIDSFELYDEILPLRITDILQVVKNNEREELIFHNRNLGAIISEYTEFINSWNNGIELLKGNPDVIKQIDDNKKNSMVNKKSQLSKYLYNNLSNYSSDKQISVKIITWNIAGFSIIYKHEDISELFNEEKDIYILNLQETIPLTLNTFYSSPLIVQEWISYILNCLSKSSCSDYEYLSDNRLLGLTTIIIVKKWLKPQISNVELSTTGTGILNVFGNKGAILISFNLSFDKDVLAHIEELKTKKKQQQEQVNIPLENTNAETLNETKSQEKEEKQEEEIIKHGYKIVLVNCHLSSGDQNISKRKKQLQSIENNLNLKKFYKSDEFSIFNQKSILSSSMKISNSFNSNIKSSDLNQDTASIGTETLTSGKLENDFEPSSKNNDDNGDNIKVVECFTDLDDIEIKDTPSSKLAVPSIGSTSSIDLSNNQETESKVTTSISEKGKIVPKINTTFTVPTNNKKSMSSPTDSIGSNHSNENKGIASRLASPLLSKFYNNNSSSLLSVSNNNNSISQREGIASRLASPILSKFYSYSPTTATSFMNGNDLTADKDKIGSAAENFDNCFIFVGGDLNFRLSNINTQDLKKPIKTIDSKIVTKNNLDSSVEEAVSPNSEPTSAGATSSSVSSPSTETTFDDSEFIEDYEEEEFKREIKSLMDAGDYKSLVKFDTLFNEIQQGNLFNGFKEPVIDFLPTYKLKVLEKNLDSSKGSLIKNKDIEFSIDDDSTADFKEGNAIETSNEIVEDIEENVGTNAKDTIGENGLHKKEDSIENNFENEKDKIINEEKSKKVEDNIGEKTQTAEQEVENKKEHEDAKEEKEFDNSNESVQSKGSSETNELQETKESEDKEETVKASDGRKDNEQAEKIHLADKRKESEMIDKVNDNEFKPTIINVLNDVNAEISGFLPSSKYNFDRIPSYCDRIFYNERDIFDEEEKAHIHIENYEAANCYSLTDHRPVFMDLTLNNLKLIDFDKRYQLMKVFLKKLDAEENSQRPSAHVIPTEFSKQDLDLVSKEQVYEFQIFNDGEKCLKWEIMNYDTKIVNYYKSYNLENNEVKFNYFNEPLIEIKPFKGIIPAKGIQRVKVKLNSINFGITKVITSLILRILGSNDFFLTYDFHFKESTVFDQSLDLLNNVKEFGSSSGIPPAIYELVNFLSNNLRQDMFDCVYDESRPEALKEQMLSPLDSLLRSRLEHKLQLDKEFINNHTDSDGDNEVLVSVIARTLIFMLNSLDGGIIPKEFSTFILTQEEERPIKKKGFFNNLLKSKTDKSKTTDIVTKILEFLPGLRANVFMYVISFLTLYTHQYGNKQADLLVSLFEEALFKLPKDATKFLKNKRKEILKILIWD